MAHNHAKVLVIGEALIDVVNKNGTTNEHPGGSPANVALGLSRLGVATSLLSKIGNDVRGNAIKDHLNESGVAIDPASSSPEPTSIATATIDNDGSARYNFDLHWTFNTLPTPKLHQIIHTGSVASFHPQSWKNLHTFIASKAQKSLVTYDPNIRPDLAGERADAISCFESWCQIAHVVKLSDEDAQWLYPSLGIDVVADRIIELGAALVAITAGSAGSHLYSSAHSVDIPPIPTTVVDTIGAGDSYMSALIFGLLGTTLNSLDRETIGQIGQRAANAAAITVSREGANPPTLSELRKSNHTF